MLASGLLAHPLLCETMFAGLVNHVPNVFSLQQWLEHAWALGIDPDGAAQLGGNVYGTNKWIGATDVAACLRGMHVPAQVLDFHAADDPSLPFLLKHHTQLNFYDPLTHTVCKGIPKSLLGEAGPPTGAAPGGGDAISARHSGLVSFVWNHFSRNTEQSSKPGTVTGADEQSSMPLFLQHDGHSRTIVGIERRRRRGPYSRHPPSSAARGGAGGGTQRTLNFPTPRSVVGAAALRRAGSAALPTEAQSPAGSALAADASRGPVDLTLSDSCASDSDVEIVAESPARHHNPPSAAAAGGVVPVHTSTGTAAAECVAETPHFNAQDVFDLSAEEVFLILLDPVTLSRKYTSSLGVGTQATAAGWERHVKRGLHTLRHPQYQVVYVDPNMGPIPAQEEAAWRSMHGIKVISLHVLQSAAQKAYGKS